MTHWLRVGVSAFLLLVGCDSAPPPDGGSVDAGSTGPDIDSGWDRCRDRGRTRHPDPPAVPACAVDAAGAPTGWDSVGAVAPRTEGSITGLAPTSIELTTASGEVLVLPWLGPDPADYFELGEQAVLEVEGTFDSGWERLDGASSTALRVRFPSDATEVSAAPVALAYGVASCTRGGGSYCDCGHGGYAWFEHALVAGSVAIEPRATALVEGWSVTHVTAPRVVFFGTCEAGAVSGEAVATFIRRR